MAEPRELPSQEWEAVDRIVAQFESAWQGDARPEIGDYLSDSVEEQALLIELIHVDFEKRTKLEEPVDVAEYFQKFPQLSDAQRSQLRSLADQSRLRQRKVVSEQSTVNAPATAETSTVLRAGDHAPDSGEPASPSGAGGDAGMTQFGDYELLGEIARGGMGVVYKARQISLNRVVAVKMILSGQLADEEEIRRFHTEAEAAANLQHSNIVAIHEIGRQQGHHFFSMDFVEGQSLSEVVSENPFPPGQAAAYVRQIAETVQYAHEQGVLHRDLKPSNVLIDSAGNVRITDFGLAKQIEADSELTGSGQVLGTPSYMPPEQAAGKIHEIGPAADVYALGAILYTLLIGRPPFQAANVLDTLLQVLEQEPVSPRLLDPKVPRDLETICLKCLQKEAEKRYASARELAHDLQRFCSGEPITARPVSRPERVWRWCRRRPLVAILTASVALSLGLGTAISTYFWFQASRRAKEAERSAEESHRRLSRHFVATGVRHMDSGEYLDALPWFAEALRIDRGLKDREPMHRWRLSVLLRFSPQLEGAWFHGGPVRRVAFSPDGRWILSASDDGTARLNRVRARTDAPLVLRHGGQVTWACFSPSGRAVGTAGRDGMVRVWDTATGRPIGKPLIHSRPVIHVAFNPAGNLVATACADKMARIWDYRTGKAVVPPMQHRDQVNCVAFSPNGRCLATGCGYRETQDIGDVRIWDVRSGKPITPLMQHSDDVNSVAFSHDGGRIVTTSWDGRARVWDATTGQPITPWMEHDEPVTDARFTPDDRRVFTTSEDHTARLWDSRLGTQLIPSLVHDGPVYHGVVTRDGRHAITVSFDRTARFWSLETGRQVLPSLRHGEPVLSADISPDGRHVVTAGKDGTVRLWNITTTAKPDVQRRHGWAVWHATLSPNGDRVLTASKDGTAWLVDVQSGRPLASPFRHPNEVTWASFAPSGHTVATACADGKVRVWNLAAPGKPRHVLEHGGRVECVAFGPDDGRLVTAGSDCLARIWNLTLKKPIATKLRHAGPVHRAFFSRDGRLVATASEDGSARVWSAKNGRPCTPPLRHSGPVRDVAFDPSGRVLATAGEDRTARLWDVVTGRPLVPALSHKGQVNDVAFSPDGSEVITGSSDRTARVWNVASGRAVTPFLPHDDEVNQVTFSPDGLMVATASGGSFRGDVGAARIWDARTGEPLTPPLPHGNDAYHPAFTPDGRRLVTACYDGVLRVWSFSPERRAPEELILLSRLLAGTTIDDTGGLVNVDSEGFRRDWQDYRSKYLKRESLSRLLGGPDSLKPVLVFIKREVSTRSNQEVTEYLLSVRNWAEFPAEMFRPAPDLPPCGANTNSSRTWVEIYDEKGERLSGYCGFRSPSNLTKLYFCVRESEVLPRRVHLELRDRQENVTYRSNLVTLPISNAKIGAQKGPTSD